MECPKCNNELIDGKCINCEAVENLEKFEIEMKKKTASILIIVASVLLLCSFIAFGSGFDKKDNYDGYGKNSYVGGDAYNMIINSNYFTGFIVLGSSFFISAAGLFCTAFILKNSK